MLILVSGLDFGTIKKWFGDFENFDFSAIYGSRKVKICQFSTNFEIRLPKTGQKIKIFKIAKSLFLLSQNLALIPKLAFQMLPVFTFLDF